MKTLLKGKFSAFWAGGACLVGVAGLAGGPSAQAETWSAGVREVFIGSDDFSFGSDGMARVKYGLFERGFTSVTAQLRLGMRSADDSYVFLPSLRSHAQELQSLIARINHADGKTIFKPIIGKSPDMGSIARLTEIKPSDVRLWFATYRQAIGEYLTIARKHDVSEFVVGVGFHHLWTAENGDSWVKFIQDVRRRVGPRVVLSIEISSAQDWTALESWKTSSPDTFQAFFSEIGTIRFSALPAVSGRTSIEWTQETISQAVSSRLAQARAAFPGKRYVLANVSLPACVDRSFSEDEVSCLSPADRDFQFRQAKTWFDAFQALSAAERAMISEIEFLAANTEEEPPVSRDDPRFFYQNQKVRDLLKSMIHRQSTRGPASAGSGPERGGPLPAAKKNACIYFDETASQNHLGPIHSQMLANLVGGFRAWTPAIRRMSDYKAGDLAGCDAAFYIASNYFVETPAPFMGEAVAFSQSKPLFWMNYRLNTFVTEYDKWAASHGTPSLGMNSTRINQPLSPPSPTNLDPGFYRYFDYKGVTFEKLATWNSQTHMYSASPELNLIDISRKDAVQVLSVAKHSKLSETTPYAVKATTAGGGSVWYIADNPFTFVHYEDRYLIFTDLLWDVFGEKAPEGKPVALLRIEDVNHSQDAAALNWATDWLADNKVPFSMAVIPYYSDLFGRDDMKPVWEPATRYPRFIGTLKYAKARGAEFVFHGTAHQAGDTIGGFDGTSGDDYEFWVYPENMPHPKDSSDYVINRLEKGEKVFDDLGIRPIAWETPHYASSALDSYLFGKTFEWTYHRSIYIRHQVEQDAPLTAKHRFFDCRSAECRKERLELARQLRVTGDYSQFGGQVFPYIIYKDVYGQSVIPETLGNIDYPFYEPDTWRPISHPADILRRAEKLRVIRGAVASFFWHPDLLSPGCKYYRLVPGNYETEGGKNTLKTVVDGLRKLGFEFRSIGDCKLFPRSNCAG